MNVPIRLRRALGRLVVLTAAILAAGLLLPVYSMASEDSSPSEAQSARAEERAARAEERATRAEERATARAQERATRAQEREARRAARAEERAERHNSRRASGTRPRGESSAGASVESRGDIGGQAGGEPRVGVSRPCHLTVAATADRITVGETVTLNGKLLCPDGVSAADVPVTIYRREHASVLTLLTTARTATDGSFAMTPPAFAINSAFSVHAPDSQGARTVVKVAPRVTISASPPGAQESAAGGHLRRRAVARTTFTGTVSPLDTGALVALQIAYAAVGDQWHSVAFGRVGSDGSYSIAHAFRTPGEASIRTIVYAARLNMAAAISEPLPFEVTQPQNPDLTIQASADPVSYGQSVTISGIAAGAKNQPVTLLARSQGDALAAVTKGMTDASGHYTFTQEPLQQTHYSVIDATSHSTALLEQVGFALEAAATPDAVQADQQLTFSGTIAPAHVGQVVYLERAWGIGFRVVEAGTVNANSEYTIVHTFTTPGASVMRINVPTDGERQASTGASFTITATP